jgi:hypothetical protein
LCVRYVVLLAFMIPVLFGCAGPEVERDVTPVVVEEHTRPSIVGRRDNEEILRVPLLVGIEEALQEVEPVEADIATILTSPGSETEKGAKHNEQLITIHCQNADLLDVLDRIADISGLTLVVHPGVSGTVTVRLENVPWEQALDIVLRMNNLRYAIEGTVLRIFSP